MNTRNTRTHTRLSQQLHASDNNRNFAKNYTIIIVLMTTT